LDHGKYYTWGFSGISDITGGAEITGAVLSFDNIRNWDDSANTLFLWLLDHSKYSSGMTPEGKLRSYADNQSGISDAFTTISWASDPDMMKIGEFTDDIYGNTTEDISFVFGTVLLEELNKYVANGNNFAIGLDPDCHYFNDGVSLTLSWAPTTTPDAGASGWLLALSLGTFASLRRWMRK
jgi:hypothetical protein